MKPKVNDFLVFKNTYCVVLLGLVLTTGCESTDLNVHAKGRSDTLSELASLGVQAEYDIGLIFRGTEASFHFPFKDLGIPEGESVTQIVSSCECIKPKIIQYKRSENESSSAIQCAIDTRSDVKEANQIQFLMVQISLRMENSGSKEMWVKLQLVSKAE